MSRRLFPQWADRGERDFAAALLSALPMVAQPDDARRRVVRTLPHEELARLAPSAAVEPGLRLELDPQPGEPRWWLETLSPLVESVSFRTLGSPARRGWDWPLEVAVFGGRSAWARTPELGALRRLTTVGSERLIEVLCLPLTLEAAVALAPPALLPRVHTVVVLRGAERRGEAQLLDALRTRWRADAAALLSLEQAQWAPWLVALTAELSHDRPLDAALFAAGKELARRDDTAFRAPLCLGRPGAFSSAHLSTFAKKLLRKRRTGPKARPLLAAIEANPAAVFAHEIGGATEVAKLRAELASDDNAPLPVRAKRSVCAQLIGKPTPNGEVPLDVQIRVPDADGRTAVADQPLEEPTDWVDGEPHRLQLLFQDLTTPLHLRKGVQSKPLVLPAVGPRDKARFLLRVPPRGTDFKARILVVEPPARILQTLTYRLTGPDRTPSILEETVPRGLDALGGPRSDVSLSFVVNQDANARHALTGIQDGEAVVVPLTVYTKVARFIGDELDRLADGQGGKKPFAAKSTNLELLITLAGQGRLLRTQLEAHFRMPKKLDQVQIISADPNQILPLEFCYDGTAPDADATFCAKAPARLKAGAKACSCGDGPRIVCPLRFWGISRVIERHAVAAGTPAANDVLKVAARGLDRSLVLDGKVMWVMDPDAGKPAERKRALDGLSSALAGRVLKVDTWAQWKKALEDSPTVIAAVLHHGEDGGGEYELKDEKLAMFRLDERYVKPGQLVIFLGCSTAGQTGSSFTPASTFIVAGAKVVVGTYSKTVGRFAALCASELVLRANAAKPKERFAEVLRRARCSLLARGYTTAMSLVALGDADCIIERKA